MGLAERDYARQASQSSGLAALLEWSATAWLIAIFLLLFFLDALLTPPAPLWLVSLPDEPTPAAIALHMMGPLVRWTHFSFATAIQQRQVWRFISFAFVHAGIWPVFFNVVCLYLFAHALEMDIRAQRRLRLLMLFALCALAAPVTYVLLQRFGVRISEPWFPLTGAAGGVLGLVMAAACVGPDDDVPLWTSGVVLPRRTLAWIALAVLALVTIKQDTTGANVAQLGGAVVGLLCAPLVRRWVQT